MPIFIFINLSSPFFEECSFVIFHGLKAFLFFLFVFSEFLETWLIAGLGWREQGGLRAYCARIREHSKTGEIMFKGNKSQLEGALTGQIGDFVYQKE